MTDDRRVLLVLEDVWATQPRRAPDRLLAAVSASVATTPQRGWHRPVIHRPVLSRGGVFMAAALVAVVALIAVQLAPRNGFTAPVAAPSATPTPRPTSTPTAEPTTSRSPSPTSSAAFGDAPIDIEPGGPGIHGLYPDLLLTSRSFQPHVTFRILGLSNGLSRLEACSGTADASMIVFGHIMGCVEDVRIIHPSRVECGSATGSPNAATVADAILAKPGLAASRHEPALPDRLFADQRTAIVLDIPGSEVYQPDVDDPDGCQLIAGDPIDPVEIRGDISQRLILLDVGDDLIVIRYSLGGHDAASEAEARGRGYGGGGTQGLDHLMSMVYDISFGGGG